VEFLEDVEEFVDGALGDFGGCGDNKEGAVGEVVDDVKGFVADAGWHVQDEVVQGSPLGDGQELEDHVGDVGSSEWCGFALGEEDWAHEGEAVGLGWDDSFVFGGLKSWWCAEDEVGGGSVDVEVEEADAVSLLCEGEGEGGGDHAFADAAFAAGDRDDGLDVVEAGGDDGGSGVHSC